MSSKNLTDFEDKILNTPVAYGVSINLGFFGDDLKLLETNWQTEYKTNNLSKGFMYRTLLLIRVG